MHLIALLKNGQLLGNGGYVFAGVHSNDKVFVNPLIGQQNVQVSERNLWKMFIMRCCSL